MLNASSLPSMVLSLSVHLSRSWHSYHSFHSSIYPRCVSARVQVLEASWDQSVSFAVHFHSSAYFNALFSLCLDCAGPQHRPPALALPSLLCACSACLLSTLSPCTSPRVLGSRSLAVCSWVLGSHSLAVFLSFHHNFNCSFVSVVASELSTAPPWTRAPSRSHWYCFHSWSLPPSRSLFFTPSRACAAAPLRQQRSNLVNQSVARFYLLVSQVVLGTVSGHSSLSSLRCH